MQDGDTEIRLHNFVRRDMDSRYLILNVTSLLG